GSSGRHGSEYPLAAEPTERSGNQIEADAFWTIQRVASAEALMESEGADVERRFDRVPVPRVDTSAAAPMQEPGIRLDVVDEIEHLLRAVRHVRAALYGRQ